MKRATVAAMALWLGAAAPDDAIRELAPTGGLRAAINFGNPVLTGHDPATGEATGVSVDLARELGRQLGVPVTLAPFQEAREVFAAAKTGAWDVAFLAVDPVRAAEIAFTPPYVLIEGAYLAPAASPLHTAGEVDRDGVRVAVASGSAYDLYLTRTLQHAELVRFANAAESLAGFLRGGADVLANVRQPLAGVAASHPETRLLAGQFMTIAQAMGTLQGRPAGAAYLTGFVTWAKQSGFVARSLQAAGHADVPVAP